MKGSTSDHVRTRLRQAMREKDVVAAAALRSALAALGNAEAVTSTVPDGPVRATNERVAGTVVGIGAAEVSRRLLTEKEQRAVVEAEVDERLSAARELDAGGRHERAESLRAEASVLRNCLES